MGRTVRNIQFEPRALQVIERPYRHVIQAIEPEAERLLLQAGGKVLRGRDGYIYEEYVGFPWPALVIYWPIQTRLLYLTARGQEDSYIIFVAALPPGLRVELHLTYDYRPLDPLFGPLEEFFTLRVAQVRNFADWLSR